MLEQNLAIFFHTKSLADKFGLWFYDIHMVSVGEEIGDSLPKNIH